MIKPEDRRGMLILSDMLQYAEDLGDNDFLLLFRALVTYIRKGEEPAPGSLSSVSKILFPIFRDHVDRMEITYQKKAKGGRGNRSILGAPSERNGAPSEQNGNTNGSTNTNTNTNTKRDKSLYIAAEPPKKGLFLAEYVREAWQEYIKLRKRKGWPVTESTIKRMLRKLEELSAGDPQNAEKILLQSVDRAYRDLFPLKEEKTGGIDFAKLAVEMEMEGSIYDGEGNSGIV